MQATRADRTSRGLISAGIATFVAAGSHSLASGAPAPVLGVLLALVCAVPVCIALSGRGSSWPRLAVAVGISQFAFHGLLVAGLGGGSISWGSGSHLHGAATPVGLARGDLSAAVMHGDHAGAGMWIAHLCAAVLTVLALGAGERAVSAILGLVGLRRAGGLLAGAAEPVRFRKVPIAAWRRSAPRLAVLTRMSRRGPPQAA